MKIRHDSEQPCSQYGGRVLGIRPTAKLGELGPSFLERILDQVGAAPIQPAGTVQVQRPLDKKRTHQLIEPIPGAMTSILGISHQVLQITIGRHAPIIKTRKPNCMGKNVGIF